MIEKLNEWVGIVDGWVWGPWLIYLLAGTHLFLTWRTGVIQRFLVPAIRLTFSRSKDDVGDVSHFGALVTAMAATVGAGNIVGVAVAVGAGGPGAILWMWLTGVFGISTKYAEAFLAVKYRIKNSRGEMSGGPMFALERGLNMKWLGILFAVFTAIAAFGIGNMFQAKAVTQQFVDLLPDVNPTMIRNVVGIGLAVLTGAVLLGGIRRIAHFCEVLVPLMVFAYLLGCIVILAINIGKIPGAIGLIFTDAFSGTAVAGGALGAVIKAGIKRGLFSNESGLGSAPIAAAAAKTKHPAEQALVSMTGTFWDTVVVCALTGLVLVVTGAWNAGNEGAAMTGDAFETLPYIGPAILTIGLTTFVFSTLIGWSYYGEKAIEYLGGTRLITAYRWIWVAVIYLGATFPSDLVINFSDAANGLMAIPNLVSVILLSGVIAREGKVFLSDPANLKRH